MNINKTILSEDYLIKLLQKDYDQEYTKSTLIKERNCPFIKIQKNKLSVKYVGKGLYYSDVTSIQTDKPAIKESVVYYYEVKINNNGSKTDICIGLADSDFPLNKHPGQTKKFGSSYGYRSDGRVQTGKQNVRQLRDFRTGDTVGCGLNYLKNEIFFTINGEFQEVVFTDVELREFYATISLHSPEEHITLNFGKKPFKFDIEGYIQEQKRQETKEILNQNIKENKLHDIIQNYLYFQGYFETLKQFEKSSQMENKERLLFKQEVRSNLNSNNALKNNQIFKDKKVKANSFDITDDYDTKIKLNFLKPETLRKPHSICIQSGQTKISDQIFEQKDEKNKTIEQEKNQQQQEETKDQSEQSQQILNLQNQDNNQNGNNNGNKNDNNNQVNGIISSNNNGNGNLNNGNDIIQQQQQQKYEQQQQQKLFIQKQNQNRKMTDDLNLVKERIRSDSFNIEFETTNSLINKESIDFNDKMLKEFQNNNDHTEVLEINANRKILK